MAVRSPRRPAPPVADELVPYLQRYLGGELPFRLRAWDGSVAGPDGAVVLDLHSPEALRHLVWRPDELGLARAHVGGSLDIDGDVFELLAARDLLASRDRAASVSFRGSDRVRLVRLLHRLGVLGRRPPIPQEEARPKGRLHSRGTGMRLLDVGCGWGSMALHAARHHGAEVVGITLSNEQAALARRRVRDAGLEQRVDIRIQDYRDVDDGPFDAISSIGMFEHVGRDQMEAYLQRLHVLLRPEGRLLNHAISRPDPDDEAGISPSSFMGRYVFPDAALLEVGSVVSSMARTGFEVRDVHSLRAHYALTLRSWVANLEARWDDAQRLVGPGRARVWRLYLAGCALGFEAGRTSIHQVLAVRPRADGSAAMPATRSSFDVDRDHPVDL